MPPNYKYSFFDSFHASPARSSQASFHPPAEDLDISLTRVYTARCSTNFNTGTERSKVNNESHQHIVDEQVAFSTPAETKDCHKKARLEIKGQGTVSVKADSTTGFHIVLQSEDSTLPNLYLDVTQKSCAFSYGGLPTIGTPRQPLPREISVTYPKGEISAYLPDSQGPYKHWLSIDLVHGILRYGRGYCTASLVLLQAVFKKKEGNSLTYVGGTWEWLRHLQGVEAMQTEGHGMDEIIVDRFPLVRDLPPYVVKDQDVTLDDLESGVVTVIANLPEACQALYMNVAGPKIALNTPDFPDFSKAIERSVRTPGLVGYNLLMSKAKGNFLGTYLRITIGTNLGNSPGIPYVLEIWPSRHSSPIHDHGDSYAIIKVLHGEISAYYFDSLEEPGPKQIGSPALLRKDDVTWISNNNYQVHQLKNESDELCCTIQCYRYGTTDKVHYEGFRLIPPGKRSASPGDKPFLPSSDMAFGEFKMAIKKEWYTYQLENMK